MRKNTLINCFKICILFSIIGLYGCTHEVDSTTQVAAITKSSESAKEAKSEEGILFKRSNLVVADIDQSLKIYQDILGFSLFGSIKESGPDSYSYPVFKIPKAAKIRFAAFNSASQERTLALTEVKGIELPRQGTPLMSALVIRVDDIVLTIKKIKALNLETTKIKVVESERINYKEQAFIDFDGHLIVLYEVF